MNICVLIPVFNHAGTVAGVITRAQKYFPVIVVDDGSTDAPKFPEQTVPNPCVVVRLPQNQGKGAALRAGFQRAAELGFSHAIAMDADGQHYVEDLPKFISAARAQPEALILGVRDFFAAGAPPHRRRANGISSFWFRVETGLLLPDTQCGFRCYPLALVQKVKTRSGSYAFELEFMVRTAWLDTAIVPVPITCTYEEEQIRQSHFRPVQDFLHITRINVALVLQKWFVPAPLRAAWSRGERESLRKMIGQIFSENTGSPGRLAGAVGLGLFFGVAPIWGYQMIVAATIAHWLRLNKPITLLASNISIPPMMPFILFGALALGHWIFTGRPLDLHFSAHQMTRARALEFLWQWLVGSFVLGIILAAIGTITTYALARFMQKK
ncbi:MAG: DUF2062 domain-containing protein [Verrucomicrobiota bacterium]